MESDLTSLSSLVVVGRSSTSAPPAFYMDGILYQNVKFFSQNYG